MQRPFLGIEIGGTKLQLVVGDGKGRILDRTRHPVEKARGADGIREQIQAALPTLVSKWNPESIAAGFGGPVDWRAGTIARSHQIEGWSGFDLRGWLENLGGRPAFVENDSNLAALAEAAAGAGARCDPVFYFNMGSGVGGGLVVDGRIYHGQPPGEAEFGHLRLDRDGTTVEDRCSGWAVDRRLRALALGHPDGTLVRLLGPVAGGEAKQLPAALAAGDTLARQVVDELAEDLAFALSHVVHLFHPEIVVMGGGLSLVGEPLRGAVAAALPRHLMKVFRQGPRIDLAALGEDAVPVGALLLARDSVQT